MRRVSLIALRMILMVYEGILKDLFDFLLLDCSASIDKNF